MAGTTRTEDSPTDFYVTPAWCVEKLIPLIDWTKIESFHEPCLGDGKLFDLIPVPVKSWSEINLGIDYLSELYFELPQVDLVLTNPPFKLAINFFKLAFSHSKTTIMLGKVDLLGSADRRQFWNDNPPTNIIIMNERPSFTGKGSDSCVYAWFFWGDNVLIDQSPFQWISRDY